MLDLAVAFLRQGLPLGVAAAVAGRIPVRRSVASSRVHRIASRSARVS